MSPETPPSVRPQFLARRTIRESAAIILLASLAGFLYTAATGTAFFRPDPEVPGTGTEPGPLLITLTLDEARQLHAAPGTVFIDARSGYEYANGHISGALNLPLDQFSPAHPVVQMLPTDHVIITYCDGEDCHSSKELARRLFAQGFRHVKVFYGGWHAWRSHGLPEEP